ncbi:MAG: MarR family transcriptional regulator [Amnibacterium sp.]
MASRALLGIVARSVAPALERVSLPQFRLLVILSSSGPMKQGLLSERAGLSAPSTSRMVDRLIVQGLVQREASEVSRREVVVAVTEEGRTLVRQVTAARRAALAEVLDRVPEQERDAVVAGFGAFATAAGEASLEDLLLLGV